MIQPTQSNREPRSSCLPQFAIVGLAALLLVPVAAASDHPDRTTKR
jgi:hypothetical protein